MSFSLKELQREYGADFHWRSYELRPAGSPPIPDWYLQQIPEKRKYFVERIQAEHGIEIQAGPFGINSRPALILEKYALAQGQGEAYHSYVERAYWMQGQDIAQPEVLNAALKSAGLAGSLAEVLTDPQYEAAVNQDIQQAAAYGLSGVPAVVFNNRYLVSGAQPYPVFQQVMERVLMEQPG